MFIYFVKKIFLSASLCLFGFHIVEAQTNFKLKFENSSVYAGIEVGAKGVKMSILEIGKNAQKNGSFNVLKDTSINTDFISFSQATYQATLTGFSKLFDAALSQYKIPTDHIFTVISSGVKVIAEKGDKMSWVNQLIAAFKQNINEPNRDVPVIDVTEEARLSHLGIVPDSRRYTTFLIDIGSGNTKGGFFPLGNTKQIKLFQLNWGTKSTANESANLMYPELIDNAVVPVTFEELKSFNEKLLNNYAAINDSAIISSITDKSLNLEAIAKEIKRVNQVFDQRALMAGTGLLLKIMRQFEGVYEKKQFYLVKNGQVGWISAYVNKYIGN